MIYTIDYITHVQSFLFCKVKPAFFLMAKAGGNQVQLHVSIISVFHSDLINFALLLPILHLFCSPPHPYPYLFLSFLLLYPFSFSYRYSSSLVLFFFLTVYPPLSLHPSTSLSPSSSASPPSPSHRPSTSPLPSPPSLTPSTNITQSTVRTHLMGLFIFLHW